MCVALGGAGSFGAAVAEAAPTSASKSQVAAPERMNPGKTPPVPRATPAPYAVAVFENRSGFLSYDWMKAAVPFTVAEKLERHSALRPVHGPLVVSGQAVEARPDSVADFAAASGARWVWTGWFKRLDNWDLQLGIALWKIDGGVAMRIGETVGRGDFKLVHELTATALETLCASAGMPLAPLGLDSVRRQPTADHYAFTLFGRGLGAATGTVGRLDLEAAAHNLGRAVFIDPNFAEAHRVMGEVYLQLGKTMHARARFSHAVSLHPDYYAALVAQADGESAAGNLRQVRDLDVAMLHLRPWDLERRYHLGKTAWQLGEIDQAFLELDRVVAQVPTDVRARRILVLIHASRGQSVDLVRELEAVARLDDDDVPTKLDLAAAYVAARREIDAIRTYDAIVARDPKQWQALKFLGDLHARAGRSDKAIGYWSRAISANPRDPRPYFMAGAAYVAKGDDLHARRLYIRAQRFGEYLGEAWNNLGAISYREGKLQESLWYLRRAVKKSPRSALVRYNLALSLSAFKDTEKALAEIEVGLALDPKHVGLSYLRGVALLRRGEAGQARQAFQAVLKLDPDHADARHNLDLLERMERRAAQGSEIIRE